MLLIYDSINYLTQCSQLIANSLKVHDINRFRKFFQRLQFSLFFSSTCSLFSSLRGPIQFVVNQKLKSRLISWRISCFVCCTIRIFVIVLLVFKSCVSFQHIRVITEPNYFQMGPNWNYLIFRYIFN